MTQKPAQRTMSPVERGYAVTWHEPRRAPYAGTLALGPTSLRFEGAARHGRTLGQTLYFRDLVDVRVARRPRGRAGAARRGASVRPRRDAARAPRCLRHRPRGRLPLRGPRGPGGGAGA